MAALTDITNLTERLVEKAQEMHEEAENGDFDFVRLTQLADEAGIQADRLATLFQQVDDVLAQRLEAPVAEEGQSAEDLAADLSPGNQERGGNGSRSVDDSTREELYERAKRMRVPGRSEMTKDELAKAVRGGRRKAAAR